MKKNPIVVFTGLAIAAVAAVAGLTRDQWMTGAPQQIAGAEVTKAPETNSVAEQSPSNEIPAEPAAQQSAAETEVPAQPAAEVPAATAEAPAAAGQQTAAVEPEQAAPATEGAAPAVDTPVAAPAGEKPAASTPPAAAEAAKEDVPTFDTVRIEKSGEAVIAGTAEAGSEVVVKLDGEEIGKAVANSDGAFVVVPDAPIPSGSGALTIEATGKGDAAPTQSEESVAVIVPASEEQNDALVALVSPDAPTRILQKPEPDPAPETQVAAVDPAVKAPAVDAPASPEPAAAPEPAAEQPATAAPAAKPAQLVSIDAVDYDGSGNIVFSGQGEPGNGARVYVDNKFVGDAAVGEDGRWSFAGTADIASGVHALRVDGIDAKGSVINRVEVPFFREETEKVVAAATPAEQPAAEQPAAADQTVAKSEPEAAAPAGETSATAEQQTAAAAATEQPETAVPAVPKDGRVVIQPGNNLWRISRVLYGSGTKYTLLYQANKDQIRDPDMIYPGQIFMTPDVSSKVETIDPDRRDPLTPEENAASAQ